MAWNDLFRSKEEREKEKRKEIRRRVRRVEREVGKIDDRVRELQRKRDAAWSKALAYRAEGQMHAAKAEVAGVRDAEVSIAKLRARQWYYDKQLTKIDQAGVDVNIAEGLRELGALIDIDPDNIEAGLGDVGSALGEQSAVDDIIAREYQRTVGEAEREMVGDIPSIEDLMSSLDEEATGQVDEVGTNTEPRDERISEAYDRLKRLREKDT